MRLASFPRATAFGIALAALLLSSCGDRDSRFQPVAELEVLPQKHAAQFVGAKNQAETLRVAIAPVISMASAFELYQPLVDHLASLIGRPGETLCRKTYADVNQMVEHGECDLALICSYAYVKGRRDFGMQALCIPQVKGKTTYHSFIIVPRSSTARSLKDLRGQRLASADKASTSGWLYPASWVKRELGEDAREYFGSIIFSGSHDKSVYAVLRGLADGAAVDSIVYESIVQRDAAAAAGLKVIQVSEAFPMPPVVAPRGLEPKLRAALKKNLLAMHLTPQGREVLKRVEIERFVEPASDYRAIDRLAAFVELP